MNEEVRKVMKVISFKEVFVDPYILLVKMWNDAGIKERSDGFSNN